MMTPTEQRLSSIEFKLDKILELLENMTKPFEIGVEDAELIRQSLSKSTPYPAVISETCRSVDLAAEFEKAALDAEWVVEDSPKGE